MADDVRVARAEFGGDDGAVSLYDAVWTDSLATLPAGDPLRAVVLARAAWTEHRWADAMGWAERAMRGHLEVHAEDSALAFADEFLTAARTAPPIPVSVYGTIAEVACRVAVPAIAVARVHAYLGLLVGQGQAPFRRALGVLAEALESRRVPDAGLTLWWWRWAREIDADQAVASRLVHSAGVFAVRGDRSVADLLLRSAQQLAPGTVWTLPTPAAVSATPNVAPSVGPTSGNVVDPTDAAPRLVLSTEVVVSGPQPLESTTRAVPLDPVIPEAAATDDGYAPGLHAAAAMQLRMNDPREHLDLGRTYQDMGEWDRALEAYRRAGEIAKSREPLLQLAALEMAVGCALQARRLDTVAALLRDAQPWLSDEVARSGADAVRSPIPELLELAQRLAVA